MRVKSIKNIHITKQIKFKRTIYNNIHITVVGSKMDSQTHASISHCISSLFHNGLSHLIIKQKSSPSATVMFQKTPAYL